MTQTTRRWSDGSLDRPRVWLCAVVAIALIGVACTTPRVQDETSNDQAATDQAASGTVIGAPGDDGIAVPLPNAAAVFAAVGPAIALVRSPDGTGAGTGVLAEGGFLITSASAVGTNELVEVRMAGAPSFRLVPVLEVDRLLDIAVLGPMTNATTVLSVEGGGAPAVGSAVFLLGFASAEAGISQPSISAGLLSGERSWEPTGVTFLLSDVAVIPGQLGGALVSMSGALLGVAGPRFGDDRVSLFVSASDILNRLRMLTEPEGMIAPQDVELLQGATFQVLGFFRDTTEMVLVAEAPAGAELTVTLDGDQDGALSVLDDAGNVLGFVDETSGGVEVLTVILDGPSPYVVAVENLLGIETDYELSASFPLALLRDAEDGRVLMAGDRIVGALNLAGDEDIFTLQLAAGQSVQIAATSITSDTFLTVEGPGVSLFDDDTGSGLLGTDAELTVGSENGGQYRVVVSDVLGESGGAYLLIVRSLGTQTPAGAEEESDEAEEPVVVVEVGLPAGHGLALRGDAENDELVARLTTVDVVRPQDSGAFQIVSDDDGVFQVLASMIAEGSAQATVVVSDAEGVSVVTSTVLTLDCGSSECLGTLSLAVRSEPGRGPWSVGLVPLTEGITAWQLEVLRSEADEAVETLSAQ